MKTVIIVQARMTSSRFPGMVLKPVMGKPLLEYQLERLRKTKNADEILIATTQNSTDDSIVDFCAKKSVKCFRGSEDDILDRYYSAAKSIGADIIVRVTSDCPIIDPEIIDRVIIFFKENKQKYDYVSNCIKRTFPRGMDTEVFSIELLKEAHEKAVKQSDREHVTSFFYKQPERYRVANLSNTTDCSQYRWTVDTPEDFDLISKILSEIYPLNSHFSMEDALKCFEKHPEWLTINYHIEQKKSHRMRVCIRVDATEEIGSGHAMRCLALAEKLRDWGNTVEFYSKNSRDDYYEMIERRQFSLTKLDNNSDDASATIYALQKSKDIVDWLIVDHYGLDKDWESRLRPHVKKIFAIDDLANRSHDCDILLDYNFFQNQEVRYQGLVPKNCELLLGTKFSLIREEFSIARGKKERSKESLKRVLIHFGGADRNNVTLKALESVNLLRDSGLEVDVIIDPANHHRKDIEEFARGMSNTRCHLVSDINEIISLMSRSDISICDGGISVLEHSCLGLSSITISTCEKQIERLASMAEHGFVLYLGDNAMVTPEMIYHAVATLIQTPWLTRQFTKAAQNLIDGHGSLRVVRTMIDHNIVIRMATANDCDFLFYWRNAEKNRQFSIVDKTFTLEEHRLWFKKCSESSNSLLLIGESAGEPVGVLRYDIEKATATVSIYLVPGWHGKGYGPALLKQGSEWLKGNQPGVRSILAHVKLNNIASKQAFIESGFAEKNLVLEAKL